MKQRIESIVLGKCKLCDDWVEHIKLASASRAAYRKDRDTYPNDGEFYFSADMQKVIMLPRLPGNKTALFTRRIIAFHETFAPLVADAKTRAKWKDEGKVLPPKKPIGIIWHEGIQGRDDEDIASTFIKVLEHPRYRDAKSIVEWADNCAGQMKNWSFYCALVAAVNKSFLDDITIKYFEKGHTFMSADAFHASVERNMRDLKKVMDFSDFKQCIEKTGESVEMRAEDFIDFRKRLVAKTTKNADSIKYPLLADVAVVQFRKGSTKMYWKKRHTQDEFNESEFMLKKYREEVLKKPAYPLKSGPRGVNAEKKRDIISKIGPCMPESRLKFWRELIESDLAKDLTLNYDKPPKSKKADNKKGRRKHRGGT